MFTYVGLQIYQNGNRIGTAGDVTTSHRIVNILNQGQGKRLSFETVRSPEGWEKVSMMGEPIGVVRSGHMLEPL